MNNRLVAMLVVALVAAGCSRENSDAGGGSGTRAPTAAGTEPVAAVLQSTGTPVAKLGFVVVTRPVVGVQSELRLEISAAAVAALQVSAEAGSLTIDPSTAQASVSLAAGATASHLVKLTPQHAGLAEVTVRLKASEGAEAVYVIPVLVAATSGG